MMERLVDAAARRCGFDPVALRRRNLVTDLPAPQRLRDHHGQRRLRAKRSTRRRRSPTAPASPPAAPESEARGKLRGLGLACFLETARGSPGEWAAVRFAEDGIVDLAIGTQSNGQGHETSFAQVAADRLGLAVEAFRLVQADTALVARGNGHGGARSLHMGGTALVLALDKVLDRARRLAAHLLQAAPGDLAFAAGRFTVPGTERGVDLAALARAARDPANLPDGMAPGLDAEADNPSDLITFPGGAHVAEVEVDPETGAIGAAALPSGRRLRPAGEPVADGRPGARRPRPGHRPGADGARRLRPGLGPAPERLPDGLRAAPRRRPAASARRASSACPPPRTRSGVKGAGQAGAIAAPHTVMLAVLDALAPLGVAALDMPATPERVWRAIRDARGGAAPPPA